MEGPVKRVLVGPIPFRTLHEHVVDGLGRRIVGGEFGFGVLPNEADLCIELDVSRGVLREAVKRLSGKGLLEVRPRTGTRVQPKRAWNLLDPFVLAWSLDSAEGPDLIRQLTDLRAAIEPVAAAAMAANKECVTLANQLALAVNDMQIAANHGDRTQFVEADLIFHQQLIAGSRNILFAAIGSSIAIGMRHSLETSALDVPTMLASVPLHSAVVRAVAAGSPDDATREARQVVRMAVHNLHQAASLG